MHTCVKNTEIFNYLHQLQLLKVPSDYASFETKIHNIHVYDYLSILTMIFAEKDTHDRVPTCASRTD